MPIREAQVLIVDTLAEKTATPTDTAIELLICKDDGYLYRKVPDGLGGWAWGRKSTMSTSVYDINNDGVVDNAGQLGGNLPGFYASQDDLTNYAPVVGGKIPTDYLPPMTTGDALGSFANQAAMLAVTQTVNGDAVSGGDFGIRTDTNQFCVLSKLPASTLANWGFIQLPSGVVSVNDKSGSTIVLDAADLNLGNVTNTSDANKPVSTAQAAADTTTLNAAKAYSDTTFLSLSTTVVPEGVNKYYTDGRADARVTAGINNLIAGAPAALDTLNEIATRLASDESTVTALTSVVSGKENPLTFNAPLSRSGNTVSLPNLSGTNNGDETLSTIKSKLGISTLSGSNTGDETQATINTKIGYTPEQVLTFNTPLSRALNAVSVDVSGLATTASVNLQNSSVPTWQRLFTGQFLTTDGTLTPVFTSAVIPDGTSVWVDCTIHGQYASGQGQAVLSMQGVVQKTSGSNIRMSQAVRLQTTGDLGLAIATSSITLNTSLQKFIVNIQGKAATNIKWSGKIEINQFTMV